MTQLRDPIVGMGPIAKGIGDFQQYSDPKSMIQRAEQVVAEIADDLAAYPHLAKLLRQLTPGGGPPLLVAAFAYYFRREVEEDQQLAHGLFWDGLRQLSASQEGAFAEVGTALTMLGDKFDQAFEQLTRIEGTVLETNTMVLEIQTNIERLLAQYQLDRREIRVSDSLLVSPEERPLVKQLIAAYRGLPETDRYRLPSLLNAVGKLEVMACDFDEAQKDFQNLFFKAASSGGWSGLFVSFTRV